MKLDDVRVVFQQPCQFCQRAAERTAGDMLSVTVMRANADAGLMMGFFAHVDCLAGALPSLVADTVREKFGT
jgi:hypothetical protein